MQTRSSSRLVSDQSSNPTSSTNPNPKGRNRRRSKQRIVHSNLEEHSPPVVTMADQRTMAQLLQAPTEGYEDAIVNKQFFGHNKEDQHAHIRYFNKITSTLKFPNVPNMSIKLMLFPSSLKDQDSLNSAAGGNFLDKMPHECLRIIENKSKVHYSRDKPVVSKVSMNASTSGVSPDVAELKDMVNALLLDKKGQNQSPAPVKAVEESCVTCGGAHSYRNCPATDGNVYRDNIQEFISQASAVNYNQGNTIYRPQMMSNQIRPLGFPPAPAYQASAPQTQYVSNEDFLAYVKANDALMKNMQTQGQNMQNQLTYVTDLITKFVNSSVASTSNLGTLPSNTIANPKSDLKAITTQSGVSYDGPQISPKAVQSESPVLISKPVISEPAITPFSAPKPNLEALIPYPSRRNDERNPLIGNKEKLSEMARTPVNEHCFAVLLKKLFEKLGDPGKFLIPCDFSSMAECLTLADLSAGINLMPFLVWKRLTLPDLTPTCMTLELADRSISRPVGVAEDVYVKVGSFHFLAEFVVVDFDADPRVPLILKRSFLKTGRALIDVFEGDLTLRVGKEAITFNLDQTSRYSANYSDMTEKRIDVINMACEEYSKEVLGFFDTISSGSPTPYHDPIVSTTSPTLTPFGNNDFLFEEHSSMMIHHQPPPNQRNYLPEVHKELKICEAKTDKSSVDEPPVIELKALPPYLEYVFLEGDDKLLVIIVKDLSIEEKIALLTVLKSHKRVIAWKLSDIKGINPEFCTHKILMEEDFTPAVQHQRRVNPKIYDVIKQVFIKLIDAGLIYPISDSPWVSPVHCVPKKGGLIVVENEDNELILTRLVMSWRVYINFFKLNEATRKDHFPLPFIDQMLERLAGNQYYCLINGFSGYFQIPIDPKDQEKTTFTCPYGTFAYPRMPFGLCNAPGTFQRCMMEKSHFMVKEEIVLGHKISKQGIEVDKAKVNFISKLPHPTTVKGIKSFLGHAGFYRCFIKDFSKIARPMTRLLEKDTPFNFSQKYVDEFQTLKRELTEAPILISPNWDMPFELMCDASDFAIGAVLGCCSLDLDLLP
nr:reverse transcriptase domain-containing protein [Tanacetum cinerariifolium]